MKKLTYLLLIAYSLFFVISCTKQEDSNIQTQNQSQNQLPKSYFKAVIEYNNYRYDMKYPNINGVFQELSYVSGNIPNFSSANYRTQEIDFYGTDKNLEFRYLNAHNSQVYIKIHFKTPVAESGFQGLIYHVPAGKARVVIINPTAIGLTTYLE